MIDKKTRDEIRYAANVNIIHLPKSSEALFYANALKRADATIIHLLDALEEAETGMLKWTQQDIDNGKAKAKEYLEYFGNAEIKELKAKLKEAEKLNAKWSEDWSQLYDECFKAKTKLKSAEELIAKDDKIKGTMEVKCYACDGDDKYDECTCLEIYDQRDKLLGEALALTLKEGE